MLKRPQIGQASLFETKLNESASVEAEIEHPYAHPQLFLGTSAFTAPGWPGTFYPIGMKPTQYLSHYAKTFQTVEIDSTFYATPSIEAVRGWYQRTPSDFVFAAKVPQVITHEKVLKDCDAELAEFVERMNGLNEKLGPMLLQFPWFNRYQFKGGSDFLERLRPFLGKLPQTTCNFVVEIRNKSWLDESFLAALREHNVALALTDTNWIARPWEMKKPLDLITANFAYVRWLGHRKEIEKSTTTWDKTIVDRTEDLKNWVEFVRQMVLSKKLRRVFLFANNHYAGHGPATVRLFWDLWKR